MWWFFNEKNKYINNEPDVKRVNEDEIKEEEEEPKHRAFLDKLFHKDEEEQEKDEEEINEQITINLNNTNKKKKRPSSGMVVPDIHTGKKLKKRAGVASIKDIDAGSEEELFTKKKKEKEEEVSEELNLQHGLTEEEYNYDFPPIDILADPPENVKSEDKKSLLATAEKLRKTLQSFGVSAKVENVSVGPAITRFELAPAQGVRVNKISNLADDIALSLEAETIRIEAPIPGKHTVGIEVPNKFKSVVGLKEIIESDQFQNAKSKLTMALGKDVAGDIIVTDIAKMPHVLIAGATGSGKSVCINTLITSIIYIDRFCDKNNYYLTQNNIFRILLSACLLSIKFNEDITVNYKTYSEIACVSIEDLKNLEFNMYLKLHFSLKVKYDLYKSYYKYFSNYSAKKND
jgi:S-DNA-T family DNA segregation ATPase FtsK/SpoIIIE